MIAAHIHNVRCIWIKMMGVRHGIAIPRTVDPRRVRASELLRALSRSSDGRDLSSLSLSDWRRYDTRFDEEIFKAITPKRQ